MIVPGISHLFSSFVSPAPVLGAPCTNFDRRSGRSFSEMFYSRQPDASGKPCIFFQYKNAAPSFSARQKSLALRHPVSNHSI